MVEVETPSSASKDSTLRGAPKSPSKLVEMIKSFITFMSSMRMLVLALLCLQNSAFTLVRRYSQGVLKEQYSKHEVLLVQEIIKMAYSAWMISKDLPEKDDLQTRLKYLVSTSSKMAVLALIYGTMNILGYVALRNIGAGIFTIFAQCKILSTAACSSIMLNRSYSWAKWRALISLMMGVLLFSSPIWGDPEKLKATEGGNAILGTCATMVEVTLSGFASIYFEKVIKTDSLQLGIWERNFQLALGSFPVYMCFIMFEGGGEVGFFGGWSFVSILLSCLGAGGGMLVALSIKYGDSILKTLATTGAIVLSSILDYLLLGGPLTPIMAISGVQVVIAICNYTFDTTPVEVKPEPPKPKMLSDPSERTDNGDEEVALVTKSQTA